MPLPCCLVVKYRSKIRARCPAGCRRRCPRTRSRLAGRAAGTRRDPEPSAVRHRLTGVERQIQKRLLEQSRVGADAAANRPGRRAARPRRVLLASALSTGISSSTSGANRHRLQLQIFGPRELQEALHDFVEPPDLRRDDRDVLQRRRGSAAAS